MLYFDISIVIFIIFITSIFGVLINKNNMIMIIVCFEIIGTKLFIMEFSYKWTHFEAFTQFSQNIDFFKIILIKYFSL